MADYSFLSDSDDEKAVENLLLQAKDQVILEQLAAINCSGFIDSDLPTHLESRFRKLKSFPTPNPNSISSTSNLPSVDIPPKPKSKSQSFKAKSEPKSESNSGSNSENNSVEENDLSPSKLFKADDIFTPSKKKEEGGKIAKDPQCRLESSPIEAKTESNSGNNSVTKKGLSHSIFSKGDLFSAQKKNPDRKMAKQSKSSSGSISSRVTSTESTSPPQKSGCFWFSPKKGSSKTNKEKKILEMGIDWEKEDELLSDLNKFSAIKQKKLLKKAMMIEEKINRDAEKIAKWGK